MTDATRLEAMCGVLAVVAACRLMATVSHDRLVMVGRHPRVRRETRRPWAALCHRVAVKIADDEPSLIPALRNGILSFRVAVTESVLGLPLL